MRQGWPTPDWGALERARGIMPGTPAWLLDRFAWAARTIQEWTERFGPETAQELVERSLWEHPDHLTWHGATRAAFLAAFGVDPFKRTED
jgi:hypothetical protein